MYRIQYRPHGETWMKLPSTYSKRFTLYAYSPRIVFSSLKAATACIEEMIKDPEWNGLKSDLRIISDKSGTVAWEYAAAVAGPYVIEIRSASHEEWRGVNPIHRGNYCGGDPRKEFTYENAAVQCAGSLSKEWRDLCVRVINKPDSRVVWENGKPAEGQHMGMNWKIQKEDLGRWHAIQSSVKYNGYRISGEFYYPQNAVEIINRRKKEYPFEHLRVARGEEVYYDSETGPAQAEPTTTSYELICELTTQPAGGDTMEPDLTKPLTLKTADVVKALEANLAAEVKKRTDAEEAEKKARQDALDAIAQLTPDELYNLFRHFGYTVNPKDILYDKENKSWITPELKAMKIETDTEKFVRVLKMNQDETIEITPGQELYRLL